MLLESGEDDVVSFSMPRENNLKNHFQLSNFKSFLLRDLKKRSGFCQNGQIFMDRCLSEAEHRDENEQGTLCRSMGL